LALKLLDFPLRYISGTL